MMAIPTGQVEAVKLLFLLSSYPCFVARNHDDTPSHYLCWFSSLSLYK